MASRGSYVNPRTPQYVDPATGISYEDEPVVMRKKPCVQEPPSPDGIPPFDFLKEMFEGKNAPKSPLRPPPRAPNKPQPAPSISTPPFDPRKPQYVDQATGISYEDEPVVLRQKRPQEPPASPSAFPRYSQFPKVLEELGAAAKSPGQPQVPSPAKSPGQPRVLSAAKSPGQPEVPPAASRGSFVHLRIPQYVDPATGISYEDEPVVMRKKKPPEPPPRSPSAASESPDESIEELSFHMDERFASERIVSLNDSNFIAYIKQKEKALVYFYHMQQPANRKLEDEFSDAADKSIHGNYGYASVNCFRDPWLCNLQKTMKKTPMIKLYSNGYEMSNIDRASEFNADQMNMLMKMTPVLNQPRVEIGLRLQSEAREQTPLKKRRFFMCT